MMLRFSCSSRSALRWSRCSHSHLSSSASAVANVLQYRSFHSPRFQWNSSTSSPASSSSSSSPASASSILRPPLGLTFDQNSYDQAADVNEQLRNSGGNNSTVGGGNSSSSAINLALNQINSEIPPSAASDPRMLDCILVRHGESEGNIAYNRSWEGDHSLYTGAFLKRHSSLWRLSDRGREQARIAGEWLREQIAHLPQIDGTSNQSPIYRYYVSEYIRAMETAALMEMPNAKWFVEVQLRERDWGTFDIMSQKERVVRFSEETRRRDRDSLFYAPPGGESLVHVLSRVDGVLTNFNRQCANRRCIVVCHGEVMWAFRLRFERLSQLTYREMEAASSSHERIHNAQILWYSRRSPITGEISAFFRWKRSVCPWDLKRSSNEWQEISRVEHTNESLAAHVNRVKRIYGHEKSFRAVQQEKTYAEREAQQKMIAQQKFASMTTPHPNTVSDISASSSAAGTTNTTNDSSSAATSSHPSTSTQPPPLPRWSPAPGWPFLSPHPRVLVLTKTPRYEHEKNSTGLKGQDLHAELSKLGFVSDRLVQSYVRHMEGLAQLTLALQQHSMRVIVKHVDSATRADLEGIDLILSAGGDGTMLKAAALLGFQEGPSQSQDGGGLHAAPLTLAANQPQHQHQPPIESASSNFAAGEMTPSIDTTNVPPPAHDSTHDASAALQPQPYVPIPLIGVNTDPQHSSGVLCAFSIEGPHTAERVIEHLRKSHFVWLEKSRVEITLHDKSGTVTLVPQYAYNDVVVAERDPGRPIVYELTVDDHPAEIQRSSGVLVCTGTGSTAWMSNAAATHPDQVSAVLKDIGYKHTPADARQIADRINLDLTFESNSPEIEYFVREPLLPISSAAAVGRVGYQHRHGWASRIAVRSLGWDAVMSIDGINLVRLPKGTTAVFQIGKKPGANLTVLSLAGTGGPPFSRQ